MKDKSIKIGLNSYHLITRIKFFLESKHNGTTYSRKRILYMAIMSFGRYLNSVYKEEKNSD